MVTFMNQQDRDEYEKQVQAERDKSLPKNPTLHLIDSLQAFAASAGDRQDFFTLAGELAKLRRVEELKDQQGSQEFTQQQEETKAWNQDNQRRMAQNMAPNPPNPQSGGNQQPATGRLPDQPSTDRGNVQQGVTNPTPAEDERAKLDAERRQFEEERRRWEDERNAYNQANPTNPVESDV